MLHGLASREAAGATSLPPDGSSGRGEVRADTRTGHVLFTGLHPYSPNRRSRAPYARIARRKSTLRKSGQ